MQLGSVDFELLCNQFFLLLLLTRVQLWNRMDCTTPSFPALHCLPEFTNIHVRSIGDAVQPSHPLSPAFPRPLIFASVGAFPSGSLHQVTEIQELRLQCCRTCGISCLFSLWRPVNKRSPAEQPNEYALMNNRSWEWFIPSQLHWGRHYWCKIF